MPRVLGGSWGWGRFVMGEVPLKACSEPYGGSWGGVWVLVFQIPLKNGAPPSTLHPEPETRNPKPETRNPKPETRNPKPETRIPKPETRNPKSEIRNPKPDTRNLKLEKPETRNAWQVTIKMSELGEFTCTVFQSLDDCARGCVSGRGSVGECVCVRVCV